MIDVVKIKVKAGDGGKGAVAWRHEKYYPNGGPFGGDGGRGGNVWIQVDTNETTLMKLRYTRKVNAGNGGNGMTKKMHGKDGEDAVIRVPLGTMVRNAANGDLMADLTKPHQIALIAKGGKGGLGNMHFATARNNTPEYAQPGEIGESYELNRLMQEHMERCHRQDYRRSDSWNKCSRCNGTGKFCGLICPNCNGSGIV